MKHRLEDTAFTSARKSRRLDPGLCTEKHVPEMMSLFDISSKVVAAHLPFEYVEKRVKAVPEPVQERILFFSFPRNIEDIKTYSVFKPFKENPLDRSPYIIGEALFHRNNVEDAIQIGLFICFYLQVLRIPLDRGCKK